MVREGRSEMGIAFEPARPITCFLRRWVSIDLLPLCRNRPLWQPKNACHGKRY